MIILGIDTSCDETSVAVVNNNRVLSNVISSQVRYHKKYGGVVPMLAGRLHEERIDSVVELALRRADVSRHDLEAVGVTYGPGLAPALQVGIAKAKALAASLTLPLYPVNHMAGHIASCVTQVGSKPVPELSYPFLSLLVSGSHTELVVCKKWGEFQIIGQNLDDALGEAYDKVARMLGLGYPGGKVAAELAQQGSPLYELPIPMLRSGDLNFSYSGLKNAVRLLIEELKTKNGDGFLTRQQILDISASFEEVAHASVVKKVEKALSSFPETRQLLVGGGVAANQVLRRKLRSLARPFEVEVLFPTAANLCSDNGAMIAVAAWMNIEAGQKPAEPSSIDRVPYLSLEEG